MLNLNKSYLEHLSNTKPTHIKSSKGKSMDIAPLNTIVTFNNGKFKHTVEKYTSSLNLDTNYLQKLKSVKPTQIGSKKGGLASIGGHTINSMTIPPLNTTVSFSQFNRWNPSQNRGLSAMSDKVIPVNFNWAEDKKKGHLISKPGNQMLCGSCWAISAAGIIGDNFVVAGLVDYMPNLSTTWILVCFPQLQCQGGNPALAFQQIASASATTGGVVTNHCIDYSWCATNQYCNADATKHMDKKVTGTVDLNTFIPKNCGCYDANVEHLLFKLDGNVNTLAIGMINSTNQSEITQEQWPTLLTQIKKHILIQGPVLGGFLVFTNFMDGVWCKTEENKGVYLENGVYNGQTIKFDESQTSAKNFKGSHAVAIIGWGIEKNVVIDNNGTKQDVPYWYCRNSWTENWGNKGYFKMAMYPYNKLSQFDKQVALNSPMGNMVAGGIVLIKATKKPELVKLDKVLLNPDKTLHTIHDADRSYYSKDSNQYKIVVPKKSTEENVVTTPTTSPSKNKKMKYIISTIVLLIIAIIIVIVFLLKHNKSDLK